MYAFLRALSEDVKCEQNILGYVTAIKYHIYSLYSYPLPMLSVLETI